MFVLAALVAVLVGCSDEKKPAAESDAPPPTSVWGAITAGIVDGVVSEQAALQAFAFAHDVDIPGVSVPRGDDLGEVPSSGTAVREWVEQYRDQLSAEQQDVIDNTPPYAEEAERLVIDAEGHHIDHGGLGGGGRLRPLDIVSDDLIDAAETTATALIAALAQRLGLALLPSGFPDLRGYGKAYRVPFESVDIVFEPFAQGHVLMETSPIIGTGVFSSSACNIQVFKGGWSGESAVNGGLSPRMQVLLAHELIHCFQNAVKPYQLPPWIAEGTATWGATDLLSMAEDITAGAWKIGWIGRNYLPVEGRTYDAVGFWALAKAQGIDVWADLMAIWRDGATSKALSTVGADTEAMQTAWSATYMRRQEWGDPWVLKGVGIPADATVNLIAANVPHSGTFSDQREPHSASDYLANVDDDIVFVTTPSGKASVHDENGVGITGFGTAQFCLIESCKCPKDTPRAGEDIASVHLQQPFSLAFSGGATGATLTLRALDLKTACGKPPVVDTSPDEPTPPCTTGCARSNGDPHLTTVQARRYDFQGAGEYVLLRSTAGDFEVQARQQQYEQSAAVAIDTAIVVAVGDHTVQVAITGDGTDDGIETRIETRIDGQPAQITTGQTTALGTAATIDRTERAISVAVGGTGTGADGTVVHVLLGNTDYGLQLEIEAGGSLAAAGVGLLGVGDPLAEYPLPFLPDGSSAVGATLRDAVYRSLGPAWRVTGDSSKFTYSDGEGPGSFDRDDFPDLDSVKTIDDLSAADRARAESACGDIATGEVRDDCVFDVSVSGDAGFAGAATLIDELVTGGAGSLTQPLPAPTGAVTTTPPVATNGLADITADFDSIKGAAIDGDTAYLAVDSLEHDGAAVIAIDLSTGTVTNSKALDAVGQIAFAAGSLWADTTTDGCELSRLDGSTLDVVATVSVTVCPFGVPLAAGGDAVWVLDSTTDKDGLSVPALRAVDADSNTLGPPIAVPDTADSFITGGAYGVVSRDSDAYVLVTGSDAPEEVASGATSVAVGADGVWVGTTGISLIAGGRTLASYPDVSRLRGATGSAAFAATTDNNGADVLAELRSDGSPPSVIARPPASDDANAPQLSFFTDDPLVADEGWVVQFWRVGEFPDVSIKAMIIAR